LVTDIAVIGGGLIGLATAHALTEKLPGTSVTVLEAESRLARHQSGRNSGVIHSGVYYAPGSLKAELCREGRDRLLEFCSQHGIVHDICGKVIVATRPAEVAPLERIRERGSANGLAGLRLIGPGEIREIEPHVAAVRGLVVPQAGVVDFSAVADNLAKLITGAGHSVVTDFKVDAITRTRSGFVLTATSGETVEAARLVNCAGLQSDRIARLAGDAPSAQIIPFRGEYYVMEASRDHLVHHLVYPVPDPRFPFLGVHFTRRYDGTVEVGPNAVLAFGRHHYRGESTADWADVWELLRSPALWKLGMKFWRTGGAEMIRSKSRRLYAASARRLIPEVRAGDLQRGGSGIRAQAVMSDGSLADDFVFVEGKAALHVLNAPSPAATACFAIGDRIAGRLVRQSA
jgi:L-2-hydroxyglutarate oxidase LhgO